MLKPKKPIKESLSDKNKGMLKEIEAREKRIAEMQKKNMKKSHHNSRANRVIGVYKKGGMSCSCGGKGCMKCGGKKYQDGGKKAIAKRVNSMYNYGDTWAGPDSTSPGVIKAKKVAAVRDSVLNTYKKKSELFPVKNSDGWAGKTVKSLTPSKTPVKKVVNTATKKKVAPKK